jgi:predicted tellurium resistance membrane protein TerC
LDLSIFTTAEAWISLVTLMFLEVVLGVDNIVFISLTTNRLPEEKQHIGRKLGLAGAMVSRCIFLCFASFLVHMSSALFTIDLGFWSHGVSVRDLVLFFGGAYLIYKGIVELRDVLALTEEKAAESEDPVQKKKIGLVQAVATIMVMDVVFSIDSVITAVGLAEHLIIMILAVVFAIIIMMVFIDAISDFINKHTEMKILALVFIGVIGVLLLLDSLGINSGIEVLDMHMEKLMVYFAMVFAVVLEIIQMRWAGNLARWKAERAAAAAADEADASEAEKASAPDETQGEAATKA